MELVPRGLTRAMVRLGQAAQNALEVARFGGLETGDESTPYEVVRSHPVYKLRRYGSPEDREQDGDRRPPVVLVPPMMLSADVYDVSPNSSAVAQLFRGGLDPWVVDFGAPEDEEGGLERTLTDHVVALSHAVDEVIELTGGDVHLSGYSQGGMFCYQAAAYRQGTGLASLITYGSPVDTQGILPFGLDDELLVEAVDFVADRIMPNVSLPAWASRLGFRMLDPVATIRNQLQFASQLHDRDSLLPREGQRRFLMDEGWVAYPGPAIAELVKQFVVSNRMLSGGFVIDGQPVTLADIDCPILCFVGADDDIAPQEVVRAVAGAAPAAEVFETTLEAGHFGLVVGSQSIDVTWPTVVDWARWIDHGGERPTGIEPLTADSAATTRPKSDLERSVNLAVNITAGLGRAVTMGTKSGMRAVRDLAVDAASSLTRLNRLDQVRPTSRISLGSIITEQAEAAPDDTVFLFDGRGHTYRAANERIDNVVRGLLKIGVRRGSHVGVLMDTRPSALGVIAALNRLGAVAVILRPDGRLDREVERGRVGRIVADPEHADQATSIDNVPVHILGGGGGPRDLGSAVDDMEAIDPDEVELPGWYEPNPGRAQDLAFIMFTGGPDRTRVNRISNGRWALSAFGTAAAASLTRADTVLSLTLIHHPSALLTGIGGALASRARLAMTREFDPDTFWSEVRRYGATAVTYTWTMAADMLEAPAEGRDVHHPIRLFIGSGMPANLWRRVEERFAPAKVLEFYASTEGDAVLVNVKGDKVGSMGRRLPGSAELEVARVDMDAGRLVEGEDGFAVACEPGEVGMLLARLRRRDGAYPDRSLRALFEGGDAWLATGDLFTVDADGDHWLVGGVQSMIQTPFGTTPPIRVQNAIGELDDVHLCAAYGVPDQDGTTAVTVAVALEDDGTITPAKLGDAVATLPRSDRPQYIRVVDEIPRTPWYSVRVAPLRDEGIPADEDVFVLDQDRETYRRRKAKAPKSASA
ncbi:MAG: AMP-binding protein [Acidimicrobiales bacterium]|nr:AMP-binding protein [Acidimicrobiales bacterium]